MIRYTQIYTYINTYTHTHFCNVLNLFVIWQNDFLGVIRGHAVTKLKYVVYTHIYIYIYTHTQICIHTYVSVRIYIKTYNHTYINLQIHTHAFLHCTKFNRYFAEWFPQVRARPRGDQAQRPRKRRASKVILRSSACACNVNYIYVCVFCVYLHICIYDVTLWQLKEWRVPCG